MPLWRHLKVGFTWIPAFREQYTDKTRMQKKSFLGNFGKVESCSGWNHVGRRLWWSSCYLSNICEVGVSVGRKDCGYQIRALLRDNHVFFKHKAMLVAWQVALHEVWVTFWKPGSVRQANPTAKRNSLLYVRGVRRGPMLTWKGHSWVGEMAQCQEYRGPEFGSPHPYGGRSWPFTSTVSWVRH